MLGISIRDCENKGRKNLSLKLIQDLDTGNENKTGAQKHDKKQNKKNK